MRKLTSNIRSRAFPVFIVTLLLLASCASFEAFAQTSTTTTRTPTETVREFYRALHEKRFREALAVSVYKPAIDGLSAEEFEELRAEFEKLAAGAEKVTITGEQVSGDTATVFVKTDDAAAPPAEVPLMRAGGTWFVGDKSIEAAVKKSGKEYFFKLRIDTHHREVQEMLLRIVKAQLVYNSQHGGIYADIPTLVKNGLLPKDIETTDSTGYRFHITLSKDRKKYSAGAEPARYGRTGRLSFYLDQSGIKSKDVGGKPLIVASDKQ